MTMRITMLTTVMGEAGSLLTAGTTHAVSDAFGAAMVGARKATDTDAALRSTGVGPVMFSDPTGSALVRPDGRQLSLMKNEAGVVIAGDSITEENFFSNENAFQRRPRYWAWADVLLGGRMKLLNNAGVSGNTSAQLLARLDSSDTGLGTPGVAGARPGVIPFNPGWCIVHIGVNDIYGATAATFDQLTGNLTAIYSRLLAAGIRVVALTIMPTTTSVFNWSAARLAIHLRVNDWIRSYCVSTPGMYLVDAFARMVDPLDVTNVVGRADSFRDNAQHPNNVGGYLVGKEIARVLDPLVPKGFSWLPRSNKEDSTYSAEYAANLPVNIQQNPLLTGTTAATGGVATGSVPASSLGLSNGTGISGATYSVESRADGYGQNLVSEIVSTGTGGILQCFTQITWPNQSAKAVKGGTYIGVAEIAIAGASGVPLTAAQNFVGPQFRLQYNDGTQNYFADSYYLATAGEKPLPESFAGTFVTNAFTIPQAGTITTFRVFLLCKFSGAGAVQMKIGRVALLRIA